MGDVASLMFKNELGASERGGSSYLVDAGAMVPSEDEEVRGWIIYLNVQNRFTLR